MCMYVATFLMHGVCYDFIKSSEKIYTQYNFLYIHCDLILKHTIPGPHIGGNTVKMMQEMIPVTYELLRRRIDSLQEIARKNKEPPILAKDEFWQDICFNIHAF